MLVLLLLLLLLEAAAAAAAAVQRHMIGTGGVDTGIHHLCPAVLGPPTAVNGVTAANGAANQHTNLASMFRLW